MTKEEAIEIYLEGNPYEVCPCRFDGESVLGDCRICQGTGLVRRKLYVEALDTLGMEFLVNWRDVVDVVSRGNIIHADAATRAAQNRCHKVIPSTTSILQR